MRFALAFLIASACFAQATVSNVHIDPLSLSATAVRLVFDVSAAFDDQRYRWAVDPTTCSGGTGGTVSPSLGIGSSSYLVNRTQIITGFPASTIINACPEVLSLGSWSTGATVQFTTPAAGDPTPIAPEAVNTTFPVPSGSTLNVPAGDCANAVTGLQARINVASPGDTIVIPAGTVCSSIYTIPATATKRTFNSTGVTTSNSHVVVTAHGFGTIGTEVEVRVWALLEADGACLPGAQFYTVGNRCDQDSQGGWQAGYRYLAYIIDANNIELRKMDHSIASPGEFPFTANATSELVTFVPNETYFVGIAFGGASGGSTIPADTPFQVKNIGGALPAPLTADTDYYTRTLCSDLTVAFCATTISATLGGSAINITSAGSGTNYIVTKGTPGKTFYMARAPDPAGQYVTVMGGGTLPPVGTRITPESDAQLGIIERASPYPGPDGTAGTLTFTPGAFNWRFRGLLMRAATNTDYTTSVDPRGFGNFVSSVTGPENIIFDQIHLQCQPYPQRCGGQAGIVNDHNGRNVGTINSWEDNLNYFHGVVTGMAPTVASAAIGRLSAGRANFGASIFNVAPSGVVDFTISNGAGVTGTIVEYVAMNGTITVVAPNTVVGSFTACPAVTCSFTNAASPAYPTVTLGGQVRKASCPLATWTLTAGNLTSVTAQADTCVATADTQVTLEGTQANNSGIGPGPFIWSNNYAEGTGILMHYADNDRLDKHSYTVTRNSWVSLPQTCLGNPATNGLRYYNRNQLEWKGGRQILVQGNRFSGQCVDKTPASVALTITPRNNSGYMTDLAVKNNFFLSGGGGTTGCNVQSTPVLGRPCVRQSFSNNLFTLSGYGYQASTAFGSPEARGWAMFAFAYGSEILIDHNTHYNATGSLAVGTFFDSSPAGLTTITSNLWTINGGADSSIGQFMQSSVFGCPGGAQAYAALTCSLASPYTFTGNAALPGYATNNSSPTPSGDVSRSSVCTAWNGTYASTCGGSFIGSLFFNQATAASRYAAAAYVAPSTNDFRLDPSSPLIGAGSGGSNIGVDYEALMNASGVVRDLVITPASNSVTACYTTPDTKTAWLAISSDGGTTWSAYTASASSSAGARCDTLGSLSPLTAYMLRILDYYDQTAALGFYGGMVTTQSFSTVAPSAIGPGVFRGVGMRGGVR